MKPKKDRNSYFSGKKNKKNPAGYSNQQVSNILSSTDNKLASVSAVMSAALPVLLMLQGQRFDAMQLEVK